MSVNEQLALKLVGTGMMLGFSLVYMFFLLRDFYKTIKFEYDYMKHPRLIPFNDYQLCDEPHKWVNATLALRGLPVGPYKVCINCASICGNAEFMVSNTVLDQITQALDLAAKKQAAEDAVNARIRDVAQGYVDNYIKTEFPEEINDVHFGNKLRALSRFTVQALADASEKVLAETLAQTELDEKYQDWPTKMKGNA